MPDVSDHTLDARMPHRQDQLHRRRHRIDRQTCRRTGPSCSAHGHLGILAYVAGRGWDGLSLGHVTPTIAGTDFEMRQRAREHASPAAPAREQRHHRCAWRSHHERAQLIRISTGPHRHDRPDEVGQAEVVHKTAPVISLGAAVPTGRFGRGPSEVSRTLTASIYLPMRGAGASTTPDEQWPGRGGDWPADVGPNRRRDLVRRPAGCVAGPVVGLLRKRPGHARAADRAAARRRHRRPKRPARRAARRPPRSDEDEVAGWHGPQPGPAGSRPRWSPLDPFATAGVVPADAAQGGKGGRFGRLHRRSGVRSRPRWRCGIPPGRPVDGGAVPPVIPPGRPVDGGAIPPAPPE